MKVEQQPAYVLHARPFSESSLLVDVFTRDYGRLMLTAKGARRGAARAAGGKTRGMLLPFVPLLISWAGKGKLPTLTAAEQCEPSAPMRGQSLASGFYLNELLLRLLHRFDAHEKLFEHYARALARLGEAHAPLVALRIFEKNLLHHIGFGAVLDHDAESGEAIDADCQYHYIPEKGPVRIDARAPSEARTSSDALGAVMEISGHALRALHEESFDGDRDLHEARRLTRMLIDGQLNGRPLRSRRVVGEMNRYTRAPK